MLAALRRCGWSAIAAFLFVVAVIGGWKVWHEAAAQQWSAQGMNWLGFDLWSRSFEWPEGLAGAVLTWLCALGVEVGVQRPRWIWRWVGLAHRGASRPLTVLALAVLTLGLPRAWAAWTRPAAPPGAPDVIVLMVDSWRADHAGWLGAERPLTPGLDALVKSGVVYTRAIAPSGWTKPAVASQWTGLMPSRHGAMSQPNGLTPTFGTQLAPESRNWMEIFSQAGWETAMWANNPNIRRRFGFGVCARNYFEFPQRIRDGQEVPYARAEQVLKQVRTWMEEHEARRPLAAFVHLMDPHFPYRAPGDFRGRFDKSGLNYPITGTVIGQLASGERNPKEELTTAVLAHIQASYDEEISYLDHELSSFINWLQQQRPNAVVVLLSDHGEEFLEHGHLGHGHSIYGELLRVPMVIWAPGLAAERVDWQVRTLDLMPTLLELAGLPLPEDVDILGQSLLHLEPADRLVPMESGGDQRPPYHWRGLSDGRWKVVTRLPNLGNVVGFLPDGAIGVYPLETDKESGILLSPYSRIYDLANDSAEQVDLAEEQEERIEAMHSLMRARGWWIEPAQVFAFPPTSALGAQEDLLRRLGYLQ